MNLKACITVTFKCDECGEFDVIKSYKHLHQYCSCGKLAIALSVVSVGIWEDGKWQIMKLPERPSINKTLD